MSETKIQHAKNHKCVCVCVESKVGGFAAGSQTCRSGQQHPEVPFLPRVPKRHRRQCCSGSPGSHDIASWPKLDDNDNNHNNHNHVAKHKNIRQYHDACNNISENSMCPVMLNYFLPPCLRCHTSCRLWQCHRLTWEVTRWIHTEHHWTNLSRPNSNLVAPPITVTVPAPVASTTASISFFLSWAQLESTGSFEFINLHRSRAFMHRSMVYRLWHSMVC